MDQARHLQESEQKEGGDKDRERKRESRYFTWQPRFRKSGNSVDTINVNIQRVIYLCNLSTGFYISYVLLYLY